MVEEDSGEWDLRHCPSWWKSIVGGSPHIAHGLGPWTGWASRTVLRVGLGLWESEPRDFTASWGG